MKQILSATKKNNNSKQLQAGQQVNKIGKYLYKHLDGAFKIQFSPNTCDIYFIILYQIPLEDRRDSNDDAMKELTINLNITTYQNKIRVNVIEMNEYERTLGHDTYSPELLEDLEYAREIILNKVIKKVSRAYKEFDFIF